LQDRNGWEILEVDCLFDRGFATEAAHACMDYAFTQLNADAVYSLIRESHTASQAVALRNGMRVIDRCTKTFRNVDMDFLLFCLKRSPM
jgi:RimJ/RimL family protein N-acetyltransferase